MDTLNELKRFQVKEDKYYKIGNFCSAVANTLAFLPVGAIISKNLFPTNNPDAIEIIDTVSLYCACVAFIMLIIAFIFP